MKIAVYTSITAKRDVLKEPKHSVGADFILFSDRPWTSPTWTVREACGLFTDPRRNARAPKLLAHQYLPGYEYSVWIDGSMRLLVPARELVEKYLGHHDIALFPHPWRDCVYDEADACIQHGLDDPAVITAQMEKYKRDNYPVHNGLHATGVILRRHNKRIETFNDAWWAELRQHSRRDQLGINYTFKKCGITPAVFSGGIYANSRIHSYEGHK